MKLDDLTTMTPEWTQLAFNIQIFVIHERQENQDPIYPSPSELREIYNKWSRSSGIVIESTGLALWCVDYIKRMLRMPYKRLTTAADMDGLRY